MEAYIFRYNKCKHEESQAKQTILGLLNNKEDSPGMPYKQQGGGQIIGWEKRYSVDTIVSKKECFRNENYNGC